MVLGIGPSRAGYSVRSSLKTRRGIKAESCTNQNTETKESMMEVRRHDSSKEF